MKGLKYKSSRMALPLFFLLISQLSFGQTLAFPGAEGFGKYSTGGRGGNVIEVTSLKDQDMNGNAKEGTFRAALAEAEASSEPSTIVFKVSGIIELDAEIKASCNNLTIAGQTAPGDGICIKNNSVKISGENIIVRYMRFRPGDETANGGTTEIEVSCLNIENSRQVIVDHCSMSWSTEENFGFYDNDSTSVQYCILSESLDSSYHPKGNRGYAAQWGGQYASYHHNLIAHHNSRAPRFNGSHSNDTMAIQDFRNNVLYNFAGRGSIYGGESEIWYDPDGDGENNAGSFINFCYNYIKPGPDYDESGYFMRPSYGRAAPDTGVSYSEWYVANNKFVDYDDVTADNWKGVNDYYVGSIDSIKVDSPHKVDSVPTVSPDSAYQLVIANAGAIRPIRDSVDIRVINSVINGTGKIIDSQTEVGGWPDYETPDTALIPDDTDGDGMPDYWETENGLDSTDASDGNNFDLSNEGYTNLEVYLNSDIPFIDPDSVASGSSSITASKTVESLKVYPNPAKDVIYFESSQNIKNVEIFSISGSLVINKALNGATSINIEDLASGMYIIKGSTQSGEIFCNKINKN